MSERLAARGPLLVLALASLGLACGGHTGDDGGDRAAAHRPAAGGAAPAAVAVHSLRLTRHIPARVRAVCADMRTAKLEVPVACPRLIPASRISRNRNLSGPILDFQDPHFWVMTFNNGGLDGLVHWIVGAGQTASVADQVLSDRHNETPGTPKLLRRMRVSGRHVAIYRYPAENVGGGYNSGHVGAFVACGPLTVFATVHGRRHADAATAIAVDLAGAPQFHCPVGR